MVKRLKRGAKNPRNPLYLNANLLLSECLNHIQKPSWKIRIKTGGTLKKLQNHNFSLFCSTFTKSEVIQRLRLEKNVELMNARQVFQKVIDEYKIYLLSNISEIVKLTPSFFDMYGKNKLHFQDYLHVMICKNLRIPMCTHDKKLIKYCKHNEKKKLYSQVFKPEELF